MPDPQIAGSELQVRVAKRLAALERDFTLEIEFQARPGFTILFGASGAGKTTVLDCVAGLTVPDAGKISVGERVLFDSDARVNLPTARRSVGYVLQDLALFPHLTVEQNVQYGLSNLPRAEAKRRSAEILETFRIPHVAKRKIGRAHV